MRNTYGVLTKARSDAVRWGLLARNPCDAVPSPPAGRSTFDAWTLDEVRTFLAVIAEDEHRPAPSRATAAQF